MALPDYGDAIIVADAEDMMKDAAGRGYGYLASPYVTTGLAELPNGNAQRKLWVLSVGKEMTDAQARIDKATALLAGTYDVAAPASLTDKRATRCLRLSLSGPWERLTSYALQAAVQVTSDATLVAAWQAALTRCKTYDQSVVDEGSGLLSDNVA